jgi:hypothetical protein
MLQVKIYFMLQVKIYFMLQVKIYFYVASEDLFLCCKWRFISMLQVKIYKYLWISNLKKIFLHID